MLGNIIFPCSSCCYMLPTGRNKIENERKEKAREKERKVREKHKKNPRKKIRKVRE